MKYYSNRVFFKYLFRSIIQLFAAAMFITVCLSVWGVTGTHNLCPWAVIEVPILALRLNLGLFYEIGIAIGLIGIVGTLFYPRPFCGWICPLGTLFDILGDVGAKLKLAAKPVPHWLNEKMRVFAFGIAAILILLSFVRGSLACTIACPAFWLCSMWSMTIPLISLILLIGILVLSLRLKRGFCRYICPYGALTTLFVPISRYSIKRNLEVCNSCGLCKSACPMGIDVQNRLVVKSTHCISCSECIKSCKKNGLHWGKRK